MAQRNFCTETEEYKTPDGRSVLKEDGTPYMRKTPTLTKLGLAKTFFWSIAKFVREIAPCEKVIIVWDKYPYHKFDYVQNYKGDRHYSTEEDLKELDPEKDAQQIIDTQYDIDALAIKTAAKYWIISNFDRLGMQNYIRSGYEADDFAGIISKYLRINDPDSNSAIVSIDSDWDYLTQPQVCHLRPKGQVTTYREMCERDFDLLYECQLSLYKYKSIEDSLYGSHNNLTRTFSNAPKTQEEKLNMYKSILSGSSEGFSDRELFDAQLKSFDVESYPDYDKVIQSLWYLDKGGSIMDVTEYAQFIADTGFEVSLNYYMTFANSLNNNLYGSN